MRLRSAAFYRLVGIAALVVSSGSAVGVTLQDVAVNAASGTLSVDSNSQGPPVDPTSGPLPLSLSWDVADSNVETTGTILISIVVGEIEFEIDGSVLSPDIFGARLDPSFEVSITMDVPDLGAPTTPIIFTYSRVSSSISPGNQGGTTASVRGQYISAAVGKMNMRSVNLNMDEGITGEEISDIAEFLPGETVTVVAVSDLRYAPSVPDVLLSFVETYRLRIRVSVPTPVPEPSQAAHLGIGFILLLGLSRIRRGNCVTFN